MRCKLRLRPRPTGRRSVAGLHHLCEGRLSTDPQDLETTQCHTVVYTLYSNRNHNTLTGFTYKHYFLIEKFSSPALCGVVCRAREPRRTGGHVGRPLDNLLSNYGRVWFIPVRRLSPDISKSCHSYAYPRHECRATLVTSHRTSRLPSPERPRSRVRVVNPRAYSRSSSHSRSSSSRRPSPSSTKIETAWSESET